MSDVTDTSGECLAEWCSDEEWCAVTCAMDVIGGKWQPVIVHRLLERGPLRFNELADDIDGITNKMLSESLETLESNGVIDREIVSEKPVAVEYSLTQRGSSLEPVIDALEQWGREHASPGEDGAC